MYYSWLFTMDMKLAGFEAFYLGVLIKCFVEHLKTDTWSLDDVKRFDDDNIDKSVLHARLRCDICIISVL